MCGSEGPATGKNVVLFDPSSTYLQSGLITVRPDTAIMLVGYNIPDGAVFTVEGVSVGSRSMAQGFGCCPSGAPTGNAIGMPRAPDILFRSPMKLGGAIWELTPENDRLVIALPGEYLLVLNDAQYLGDVQVELVVLPGIPQLPFAYMAGIQA
jgi:hypothetical protein